MNLDCFANRIINHKLDKARVFKTLYLMESGEWTDDEKTAGVFDFEKHPELDELPWNKNSTIKSNVGKRDYESEGIKVNIVRCNRVDSVTYYLINGIQYFNEEEAREILYYKTLIKPAIIPFMEQLLMENTTYPISAIDNPFLEYFPITDKIKEMREIQKIVLQEVWGQLENNSQYITISAPVGSGKSAIAYAIMNYFKSQGKSSIYMSPLNILVDQIDNSGFNDVVTLKGRKHYDCIAGEKDCSVGLCKRDMCTKFHNEEHRKCGKLQSGQCNGCICWNCIYKARRAAFMGSKIANTNFTMFMNHQDNNPEIIIIDECDQIEQSIRNIKSITIDECYPSDDFNEHIDFLKQYINVLMDQAKNLTIQFNTYSVSKLKKEKERLEALADKLFRMIEDYKDHGEVWCITENKIKHTLCYEPVTVERFLTPLLKNKTVIMMSATPPDFPDYEKIIVGSPFPIEVRQWEYKPQGRMSMRYRDETIPGVARFLSILKGKTIVQCVSYKIANNIKGELLKLGINPLLQTRDNIPEFDGEHTRYDIVDAFIKSKDRDKIVLLVKMDRGVDFWQSDIINNVITGLPYPNPIEPLTVAKNKLLGKEWQNKQMARDIQQMMGRIFRNESMGEYNGKLIPKRGYIVDSNFGYWYRRNKDHFEEWFTESEVTLPGLRLTAKSET